MSSNSVFCQGFELGEITQSESATGKFAQGFIRACVHVGDPLWRLVVRKDVQGCDRKLVFKEGFELRKQFIQDVGKLHQLSAALRTKLLRNLVSDFSLSKW